MGFWNNIFSRKTSANKTVRSRTLFFNRSVSVTEDSSMQVAAFNRGVIYISTQIAKLPWDVKDETNKVLRNSPISHLLNLAPNEEMNAFFFRLVMVQQAIIHGNSYAEIEKNYLGQPIALWPLETYRMDVMRTETGKLVYRYSNPSGSYTYLDPKDVFHVRNFHTKDGIVGQGLKEYARDVLGIQLAADEMAGGIFSNGGIPSGVIEHPGKLSDEAYKRLQEDWKKQYGGKKTGGTAILENGSKYTTIDIDPEALQFLESRQFGILEVARFLGIPPTKFFDVTAATYSNVEQSNLEVATDTLDSWATNLEMEADVKLLSNRHGNRYTNIDLYAIFRGDMKTRSDYFKTMISIGSISPQEIRDREGMSPYPGSDKFYIANNNLVPVDRIDEVIDADIKQKEKPATPNTPAKPEQTPEEKALIESAKNYLESR